MSLDLPLLLSGQNGAGGELGPAVADDQEGIVSWIRQLSSTYEVTRCLIPFTCAELVKNTFLKTA